MSNWTIQVPRGPVCPHCGYVPRPGGYDCRCCSVKLPEKPQPCHHKALDD